MGEMVKVFLIIDPASLLIIIKLVLILLFQLLLPFISIYRMPAAVLGSLSYMISFYLLIPNPRLGLE